MKRHLTLSTLATLYTLHERGRKYEDLLAPFILACLPKKRGDLPAALHAKMGFCVDDDFIDRVLKKLTHQGTIEQTNAGVYTGKEKTVQPLLSDTTFVDQVVKELLAFAASKGKPWDPNRAWDALLRLVDTFGLSYLRYWKEGAGEPEIHATEHGNDLLLVSQFVCSLEPTDTTLNNLMKMLTGRILANTLRCAEQAEEQRDYHEVVFYLDTPLLLAWLGLSGQPAADAAEQLSAGIKEFKGKIALFVHTYEELAGTIENAAQYFYANEWNGSIVYHAKEEGRSRADLVQAKEELPIRFKAEGIEIKEMPAYTEETHAYQIDERGFDRMLTDEMHYRHARARENDVKSLRAISLLRERKVPLLLEDALAVLLTTNTKLVNLAKKHSGQSQTISPFLTASELASRIWLKTAKESALPKGQLIAYCYHNIAPAEGFIKDWMERVNKLEQDDHYTAEQAATMRSTKMITRGYREGLDPEAVLRDEERLHREQLEQRDKEIEQQKVEREQMRQQLEAERERMQQQQKAERERMQQQQKAEREQMRQQKAKRKRMVRKWVWGGGLVLGAVALILWSLLGP